MTKPHQIRHVVVREDNYGGVVEVTSQLFSVGYKCSDGKLFTHTRDAVLHQNAIAREEINPVPEGDAA